jgi:hypothetical protein
MKVPPHAGFRSLVRAFAALLLGGPGLSAQEWHNGPTPAQFMADYAKLLLAGDREGLIRLYSPAGALILGDTVDDHSSPEQIAAVYRTEWRGPTAFQWRNLTYRQMHPDVVIVNGGFEWTGAEAPKGARYNYSALLVRLDGKWRIRSEVELPDSNHAREGGAARPAQAPETGGRASDDTTPGKVFELPKLGEEVPLPRIKEICAHYGLAALWAKIEKDPPPRPFKSDGCTGWFDDWRGVSLYPAGFLHDLKYWAGYPGEEVERLVADAELMTDVAKLLKSTTMAETMFHGVRVGGAEQLQTPFSWGFGRQKP